MESLSPFTLSWAADHSTSPNIPTPVIYLSDRLKKGVTQFPLSYISTGSLSAHPVFMDVFGGFLCWENCGYL